MNKNEKRDWSVGRCRVRVYDEIKAWMGSSTTGKRNIFLWYIKMKSQRNASILYICGHDRTVDLPRNECLKWQKCGWFWQVYHSIRSHLMLAFRPLYCRFVVDKLYFFTYANTILLDSKRIFRIAIKVIIQKMLGNIGACTACCNSTDRADR